MNFTSDYASAKMNTNLVLVDVLKETSSSITAVFAGNKNKKIFHGIINGMKFLITDTSRLNCKLNNNLYTIKVDEVKTQRVSADDRFFVVNLNKEKIND